MTFDLVILALGFVCGWWAHRRHVERRVQRWGIRILEPKRRQRWLDAILGADR